VPFQTAGPAIEVSGLSKTYRSATGVLPVLKDVSFRAEVGEFVALLGPSGGGKSTLLNVIAGLETPDAGSVRIDGRPPGPEPRIAYMQQKDLLLPWRTVWDNVLLAPELRSRKERREAESQARHLLELFHLERFAHVLPAELSGGMRQRAALMRTLLCGQEILLLDEPFGALDAITRGRLQAYLLRVWRDFHKTVVLVTHDVEEALLLSNRIVLLSATPGTVMAEMRIELPHHERLRSFQLALMKADILSRLEGPDG
jgi:ABC-type nitrate/sulfonate/bicarbonate transport system ATPase subunit